MFSVHCSRFYKYFAKFEREGNNFTINNFDCVEKMVGGKMLYPYALGKTKVYFRVGSLEVLESDRLKMYTKHASFIQSCVRCNLTMMNFKESR